MVKRIKKIESGSNMDGANMEGTKPNIKRVKLKTPNAPEYPPTTSLGPKRLDWSKKKNDETNNEENTENVENNEVVVNENNEVVDKENVNENPENVEVETSTYEVQKGDNLSRIAKANNMTLDELLEKNPEYKENPSFVRSGATLNL